MNKRSHSSRPRNYRQHRQQKANLKQSNKKRNAILFPQQHNNSGGNGAHWFGKLPPHFQCVLGLALLTLVGFMAHDSIVAHDLTMFSGLLNILTLIIYMFK